MAAHAATRLGARVDIHSKRRKSELYGAQYLHQPIPGMTDRAPVTITYDLRGGMDDYRHKVYGPDYDGEVSPEDYIGEHDGWDIRSTYNNLWERYGDLVWGTGLSADYMANIMFCESERWDLIVSSIPKKALCAKPDEHTFNAQIIWALGDAPERGRFVSEVLGDPINNNNVVCNGLRHPAWYRRSRVFGYETVEWPWEAPMVTNIGQYSPSQVTKPLDNNCDCWPDVLHVGRYGRWQKGVLSHTAYQDVFDRLNVAEAVG